MRALARAVTVRGRLSDPRHIELDEPVDNLTGAVEIVVRSAELSGDRSGIALIGLCADLGRAPSSEQIDEARRELWAGFPRDDVG